MAIDTKLIDTKEAARILKVTKGRVIQLVSAGKIKVTGQIGNAFVFDRDAIKEYAKQDHPEGRPKKTA